MKTRLLAAAFGFLAVSLAGCAHTGGGGGGAYFGDCDFYDDCYGGRQYTCMVYEEPQAMQARMEISLAQRHSGPRIVGPRDSWRGTSSSDSSGSSVSSSTSTTSTSFSTVGREPVVVASPSVDRGSPRAHN